MKKNANPAPSTPPEVTFNNFSIDKPLSECQESMLIDSDTVIASIEATTSDGLTVTVDLMVRGSVSVVYQSEVYKKPSKFPAELRKLILARAAAFTHMEDMSDEQLTAAAEAFDPANLEPDDFDVLLNNWFEYIYEITDADGDTVAQDGILCEDDLHKMSAEELCAELEEVVRQVLEL